MPAEKPGLASDLREPRKLAVVTAGGSGFELPDGIAIIPITALGP